MNSSFPSSSQVDNSVAAEMASELLSDLFAEANKATTTFDYLFNDVAALTSSPDILSPPNSIRAEMKVQKEALSDTQCEGVKNLSGMLLKLMGSIRRYKALSNPTMMELSKVENCDGPEVPLTQDELKCQNSILREFLVLELNHTSEREAQMKELREELNSCQEENKALKAKLERTLSKMEKLQQTKGRLPSRIKNEASVLVNDDNDNDNETDEEMGVQNRLDGLSKFRFNSLTEPSQFIGEYVKKKFQGEDFCGQIVGFNKPYYQVIYEDADREEMTHKDAVKFHWNKLSISDTAKKLIAQHRAQALLLSSAGSSTSGGNGGVTVPVVSADGHSGSGDEDEDEDKDNNHSSEMPSGSDGSASSPGDAAQDISQEEEEEEKEEKEEEEEEEDEEEDTDDDDDDDDEAGENEEEGTDDDDDDGDIDIKNQLTGGHRSTEKTTGRKRRINESKDGDDNSDKKEKEVSSDDGAEEHCDQDNNNSKKHSTISTGSKIGGLNNKKVKIELPPSIRIQRVPDLVEVDPSTGERKVKTWHEHGLFKLSEVDDGWACNGMFWPSGCAMGCTDFQQTYGWKRYHCTGGDASDESLHRKCDFDLCEGCVQANLAGKISNLKSRLGQNPSRNKIDSISNKSTGSGSSTGSSKHKKGVSASAVIVDWTDIEGSSAARYPSVDDIPPSQIIDLCDDSS